MKPTIGITTERDPSWAVPYAQAVEKAGGIPVIVRTGAEQFDGLLLSGGGDAGEATGAYGRELTAAERATLGGIEEERDQLELALIPAVLDRGLPVFAICRGMQMLNVALGGTLLPHVPNHRHPDGAVLAHAVSWTVPGDWPARVNTTHHQALGRVATRLRVLARAEDGIIEAADLPDMRHCFATQFHPERIVGTVPAAARFFREFVNAAAAKRMAI